MMKMISWRPFVIAMGSAAALWMSVVPTALSAGSSQTASATHETAVAARTIDAKRVSFYAVALTCPAVPQIGCGSMAKPLLLELESREGIAEAWLNRAGTILAVVWSEQSTSRQRRAALRAVLKQNEVPAKELKSAASQEALKDFQSGGAWYRGAAVDRLSEEEAGILAARWVGRVREKVALTDETAQVLQGEFAAAFRRKLTGQITRPQLKQELLRAGREHLDQKDFEVLVEAFKAELELPKE